ncbi:hypothetical protein AY600_16975 [Phormidium willei BDU 130791]|nr:hypothetical protein AY600_16975 [Phormidium willei BDU 130791]
MTKDTQANSAPSSPSPPSREEQSTRVQHQSSQRQVGGQSPMQSQTGPLQKPNSPDEPAWSLHLFEDQKLWFTIAVLIVLPILLSSLLLELITLSGIMIHWVMRGMMFLVLMMIIGVLFVTIPVLLIWGIVETFRFMHRRGFSDFTAIALPLSTVAFGISLGSLLRPDSFVPLWSLVTVLTAIPLGVMLIYQPLRRSYQLNKYRKSQKHLIQP